MNNDQIIKEGKENLRILNKQIKRSFRIQNALIGILIFLVEGIAFLTLNILT